MTLVIVHTEVDSIKLSYMYNHVHSSSEHFKGDDIKSTTELQAVCIKECIVDLK